MAVLMIDRGDCESATSPMVKGQTTPVLTNATFARSADHAHGGSYSYKVTKTVAVGTPAVVYLVEDLGLSGLNGFLPGQLLTFSCWIWIPSGGSVASEIIIGLLDYAGSWGSTTGCPVNLFDQWLFVQVQRALRSNCTAAQVRFDYASPAAINESFYVDDISVLVRKSRFQRIRRDA